MHTLQRFFYILFVLLSVSSSAQEVPTTGNAQVDSVIKYHHPRANQNLFDSIFLGKGVGYVDNPVLYLSTVIDISGPSFYKKEPALIVKEVFQKVRENFIKEDYTYKDLLNRIRELSSDTSKFLDGDENYSSRKKVLEVIEEDIWSFGSLKLNEKNSGSDHFLHLKGLFREQGIYLDQSSSFRGILSSIEQSFTKSNQIKGYRLLCYDLSNYYNDIEANQRTDTVLLRKISSYFDLLVESILHKSKIVDEKERSAMLIALAKCCNTMNYNENFIRSLTFLRNASTYLYKARASLEKRLAVEVLIARSLSILPGITPRQHAHQRLSVFYRDNYKLMNKKQRMKCLTMKLYFESSSYETELNEGRVYSRPIDMYVDGYAIYKYFQQNHTYDEFELYATINLMKAMIRDKEYVLLENTGVKSALQFLSKPEEDLPINFSELNLMVGIATLYNKRFDEYSEDYQKLLASLGAQFFENTDSLTEKLRNHPDLFYYFNKNILPTEILNVDRFMKLNFAIHHHYDYSQTEIQGLIDKTLPPLYQHYAYHTQRRLKLLSASELAEKEKWQSAYNTLYGFFNHEIPPDPYFVYEQLGKGEIWAEYEPAYFHLRVRNDSLREIRDSLDNQVITTKNVLSSTQEQYLLTKDSLVVNEMLIDSLNENLVNLEILIEVAKDSLSTVTDTLESKQARLGKIERLYSQVKEQRDRAEFNLIIAVVFLIAALIAGATVARLARVYYRQKKRARESENREKTLAHTMYQVGHNLPKAISKLMSEFSQKSRPFHTLSILRSLLRSFHDHYKSPYMALQDEMDMCFNYLELSYLLDNGKSQIDIIKQKFQFEYDPYSLVKTPTFVIFNIVDNAFKHGKVMKGGKDDTLQIKITERDKYFYVDAYNPIIQEEKTEKEKPDVESSSTGLDFIERVLNSWNSSKKTKLHIDEGEKRFQIRFRFKNKGELQGSNN